MEAWIFYAILSALFSWIYNFIFKIVAERKYNSYIFTFWDYCISFLWASIYVLWRFLNDALIVEHFLLLCVLAWINVLFFAWSVFARIESMRNIDTVIFYPLYKTFWPILVTIFGLVFFKEYLSVKESIGIILWICVPLMLITKSENRIQKNLFLWVVLVLVTSILTTISTVAIKSAMMYNLNIEVFLMASFFIGILVSAISNKAHDYKKKKHYNIKGMYSLAGFAWVMHVLWFVTFALSMKWNMAVAFTINSFSILIPIILSIIFYWEHFNLKKAIVIALSIVSILMFL